MARPAVPHGTLTLTVGRDSDSLTVSRPEALREGKPPGDSSSEPVAAAAPGSVTPAEAKPAGGKAAAVRVDSDDISVAGTTLANSPSPVLTMFAFVSLLSA